MDGDRTALHFDFDNFNASSNLYLSGPGPTLQANSFSEAQIPDLCLPSSISLDQFVGIETDLSPQNHPGTSSAGQRSYPGHQDQATEHHSVLDAPYSVTYPHVVAPSLLDETPVLPPQLELLTRPSQLFDFPDLLLASESDIDTDPSTQRLTDDIQEAQTSFRKPSWTAASVAATSAPQHLLPGSQIQPYQTGSFPQTPETLVLIEQSNINGVPNIPGSNDHSSVQTESATTPSSPTFSTSATSGSIQCTWASCNKTFLTRSEYNHHSKNHTKPFQCASCSARHATKRQLDRHINEKHKTTEKYFCTVSACKRSLARNGKPFPRDDGCRKHMRRVHRMTEEQVKECGMDERTRMIRLGRKVRGRV